MADPDRAVPVDDDPGQPALVAIEEHAIGATEIFGDQPSGLADDPHMADRHKGIVDHHVILVAAADLYLRADEAETGRHVAVARQDLDPDHLVHWTASRKRRPSAMAS